jgi:1-acyl-sn-glycerol-3-phosphate acyltransferase
MTHAASTTSAQPSPRPASPPSPARDRSRLALLWYEWVRLMAALLFSIQGGVRATGRRHVPAAGGMLLVSNHLSHLDVFVLGLTMPRSLNYMARSSLFFPPLGSLIRTLGGFAIRREGIGAEGLKETLRRLRAGGVVVLFPEGTRSPDGALGPLKPGIASLAARTRMPIVPAAIAGTFEAWPRSRVLPRPHPVRVHFGPPITPDQLVGLDPEAITALLRERLLRAQREARRGLRRDLVPALRPGHRPALAPSRSGTQRDEAPAVGNCGWTIARF